MRLVTGKHRLKDSDLGDERWLVWDANGSWIVEIPSNKSSLLLQVGHEKRDHTPQVPLPPLSDTSMGSVSC
jgi:hypothetical protein